ncbi:MAG: hypothetical protein KTV16_12695, partial [Acidimicrobiia bacterium]|nr:hypothetical protein [Acidimicrobiia bacterium]
VRATVRANMAGGGSAIVSERRWAGTIPQDSCSLIGRVKTTVPRQAHELVVSLKLTADQLTVTNQYRTPVHNPAA